MVSECGDVLGSGFVHLGLRVVYWAIDFDGKFEKRTVEVENIGTDRVLRAESKAVMSFAAKRFPELRFCRRHRLTHLPGSLHGYSCIAPDSGRCLLVAI